jgi:transposase
VAIPYGVYDLASDSGWVNVGIDHDTSAFAVASIRRWWAARGSSDYPAATRLLITADAGGSNSYRFRLWKAELAAFAADTGLTITVCHFPPGTSKWNKIEHRLFSQITMNWRGRPLTSHQVVVCAIASTRTRTGLRVDASLDPGNYPVGQAVSRDHFRSLPIHPHERRGTWNYTIAPTAIALPALGTQERAHARRTVLTALADPRLTGMTTPALDELTAQLAPTQAAQTHQRRYEQRGGARRRAAGAGARSLLTDADRVLITVLYQRQVCSQKTLSELLSINPNTIGLAIAETRQLLQEHGRDVVPATLRFASPAELLEFASSSADLPSRSRIADRLDHPALTGMPRDQLAALTEAVRPLQAARTEAHRHRARGGERLPGARGGVFPQKITSAERVLVAVLHQRGVASQEILADLLDVSRRSIGEAIKQVTPLLTQHRYTPVPGAPRFTSAQAVLNYLTDIEPAPTRST